MIILTRLSGDRFALNTDLILRVEGRYNTVVTLVDGAKYLVTESIEDVARLMLTHRQAVVSGPDPDGARLRLVQ